MVKVESVRLSLKCRFQGYGGFETFNKSLNFGPATCPAIAVAKADSKLFAFSQYAGHSSLTIVCNENYTPLSFSLIR